MSSISSARINPPSDCLIPLSINDEQPGAPADIDASLLAHQIITYVGRAEGEPPAIRGAQIIRAVEGEPRVDPKKVRIKSFVEPSEDEEPGAVVAPPREPAEKIKMEMLYWTVGVVSILASLYMFAKSGCFASNCETCDEEVMIADCNRSIIGCSFAAGCGVLMASIPSIGNKLSSLYHS